MSGNSGQDGSSGWDQRVLRPPERPPGQTLKRSSSTHGVAPRIGSTGPDDSQHHPPVQRSSSRRSASAERGTWVSVPTTKPRAERWVPLPLTQQASILHEEDEELLPEVMVRHTSGVLSPTAGLGHGGSGELVPTGRVRGRILIITACESFGREDVWETLKAALPRCPLKKYPEVIHLEANEELDTTNRRHSHTEAYEPGDVFIFDYGVVICWGLEEDAEQYVLGLLAPCQVKALTPDEVHQEHLAFHYTADQPPHIQNDCITISRWEARDQLVKMAISHGLAQSCKLNLYEARVMTLVEQVRHLPESLAKHGKIRMSRQTMAKIKGQVFIQKSEVNLLSTVLDTPDFFWSAPDALRALYNKVCEYNELSNRIDLVNSRTMLIQSMLRIWSDHKAHHHLVRLDRIVIILIVVEVIIAAFEVMGFFLGRHLA